MNIILPVKKAPEKVGSEAGKWEHLVSAPKLPLSYKFVCKTIFSLKLKFASIRRRIKTFLKPYMIVATKFFVSILETIHIKNKMYEWIEKTMHLQQICLFFLFFFAKVPCNLLTLYFLGENIQFYSINSFM